jgi:PRTRC genetic system ParB family protein
MFMIESTAVLTSESSFKDLEHGANIIVSHDQLSEFKHKNSRKKKRTPSKESEIIESMKRDGIRDQVKVWIEEGTNKLQVLGGYGRWQKAKLLNIPIPCKVFRVPEKDAMRIHLQDNTQREDLTFIEEVDAALTIHTLNGSDFESTRLELGWSKTKLRERLEIAKCSQKVKDYVEERKLELGHAIILAPYSHSTQDEKADFIVNNRLTVMQLKNIMGKIQLKLSEAKFDLTDCANCEFNTKDQMNLFGSIGDEEMCRKSSCYKEKSLAWLEEQRKDAEQHYGKVIFLSQTDKKQTNLVDPTILGVKQVSTGCINCVNNVAIMSDELSNQGLITENQCIDPSCYQKLKNELAKPESPKTEGGKASKSEVPQKAKVTDKAKSVTFKPSNALVTKNKALLRKACAELVSRDASIFSVFQSAFIIHFSRYRPGKTTFNTFSDVLEYCLSLDRAKMIEIMNASYQHLLTETSDVNHSDMEKIMLGILSFKGEDGINKAKECWVMNSETLNLYTTQALLNICEKSGIKNKLEETKEWAKTAKLNKGDLIKVMVKTQPTDPLFAPSDYLSHIQA